ncbi:helix-turn-helix domain-containing protein [Nocardia miyunensis]|uniref:helix-turn-helix domain-containing protein n=1 Tax=Nocardia miyunensis TaxID=282684 RepID=UPI000832AB23|nr:helix-turn-helix transcriptional regulator [Nocardia miyunensis]
MPETPAIGSTLPRRQLGRYLVDWRTRAGYTQVKAAQLLEMGATSLNRLEKGETGRIKNMVIQAICDLYNVPPDLAEAFKGLAQQANVKSWWHQYGDLIPKNFDVYVGLETAATQIITYQPDLIPGLLQTADYNRSLVQLIWPDETVEQWEQRVQIKTQRQRIVTRKTHPVQLDVVIGEAALHRVAGSRAIMADQLRHLADISTMDNVSVRVLPFAAGFPGGTSMPPYVILNFGQDQTGAPVEPSVVFLEGAVGEIYLEKEEDVLHYYGRHEIIEAAALDETTSRSLLRRVAKGA